MLKKLMYNLIVVGALLFGVGIINTSLIGSVRADEEKCEHASQKGCMHECPIHMPCQMEDGKRCEKCGHSEKDCMHECPVHMSYQKVCEKKCEKCGHITSVSDNDCMKSCLAHMCYHMEKGKKCEKCGQLSSSDRDCMRKILAHIYYHLGKTKKCEKCGSSKSEKDCTCECHSHMSCPPEGEKECEKW